MLRYHIIDKEHDVETSSICEGSDENRYVVVTSAGVGGPEKIYFLRNL